MFLTDVVTVRDRSLVSVRAGSEILRSEMANVVYDKPWLAWIAMRSSLLHVVSIVHVPEWEQRLHALDFVALVPDIQIFAVVDLAVLALEVWV